jgi:transcriptional regulator with XRE-family HTH domain
MTIGTVIRNWREDRGISQKQIERLTGIEQRYLSQLENDKVKNPGPFKLHAILTVLGHTLDELVAECMGDRDEKVARILLVAA